jgi:hypothetical protein
MEEILYTWISAMIASCRSTLSSITLRLFPILKSDHFGSIIASRGIGTLICLHFIRGLNWHLCEARHDLLQLLNSFLFVIWIIINLLPSH